MIIRLVLSLVTGGVSVSFTLREVRGYVNRDVVIHKGRDSGSESKEGRDGLKRCMVNRKM